MANGLDPEISLQAGQNIPQFGPNMQQVLSLARLGAMVQQQQQQQQTLAALRQAYANPQNFQGGMPTMAAISAAGTQSPEAAMELQKFGYEGARQQYLQQQMETARQQLGQRWNKALMGTKQDAQDTYQTMMANGSPEPEARAAAQRVYTAGIQQELDTGEIPASQAQRIPPNFDPTANAQHLANYKQIQDYLTAQQKEKRAEQTESRAGIDKPQTVIGDNTGGKQVTATWNKDTRQFEMADGTPVKNPQIIPPAQVMPGSGGSTNAADMNVHGDDYLKTLPKATANEVKALADGRVMFPSGFALRSPYWQNMMLQVSQYDPSFDTVNYNARSKTRQDFTSGQAARNITSFNTAIGHLGTLYKAAKDLNNTNFPSYNSIANFVIQEKGDPRVKTFETARQAVSDELERSFRGTGGNVTGIEEWKKNLDAAGSPAQLQASIRTAVDLLASRIEAVGEQYQRGMGKTSDPLQLLSSKARQTLKDLPGGGNLGFGGGPPESSGEGTPGEVAGVPSVKTSLPAQTKMGQHSVYPGISKQQYEMLQPGEYYTMPGSDKVYVKQ